MFSRVNAFRAAGMQPFWGRLVPDVSDLVPLAARLLAEGAVGGVAGRTPEGAVGGREAAVAGGPGAGAVCAANDTNLVGFLV